MMIRMRIYQDEMDKDGEDDVDQEYEQGTYKGGKVNDHTGVCDLVELVKRRAEHVSGL